MRVSQPFTTVSVSLSFALMATTSLALPTDLGRSADPYANAVRYIAAVSTGAAPTPKVAEDVASVDDVPAADPDGVISVDAFEAVDPNAFDFERETDDAVTEIALAPSDRPAMVEDFAFQTALNAANEAIADEAGSTETAVTGNFPEFTSHAAFGLTPEAPTLATPDFAVFTQHASFDVMPEAGDLGLLNFPAEDILTLSAQPTVLASADVRSDFVAPPEPVAVEIQELPTNPISVSLTPLPRPASPNSSRLVHDPEAPFHFVANAVTAVEEQNFLIAMVNADPNLTVREGDENRPDTVVMSSDVLFAFGKAELEPAAQVSLTAMISKMPNDATVEIFGHTDSIGNEGNNLALGLKRAEAVRAWLLENSEMPSEQVVATGVGETDPIALNVRDNGQDDPDGRALNRRVEFAFY